MICLQESVSRCVLGNRPNSEIGDGTVEGGQCSSEIGGGGGKGGLLEASPDDGFEKILLKSILEDDKAQLKSLWLPFTTSSERMKLDSRNAVVAAALVKRDRAVLSKLLHMCCIFDAVECATAVVDGEFGAVAPLVNDVDAEIGMSALHKAVAAKAARCIEMLLRRRARTDQKTRDGRRLIAVELSLLRIRTEVIWKPDEHSVEDLVVQLSGKDLTSVTLLCEKTKEMNDVVYKSAVGGHVVDLAILLAVAPERVNKLIFIDSVTKEKATIYECVVKEAVTTLGQLAGTTKSLIASEPGCALTNEELGEKRKLLLCIIKLLQLFGVTGENEKNSNDKKRIPSLIRAAKAGDEDVIDLLLKTNMDVNVTDVHGNSALLWCLRTCKGTCPPRMKIMRLLLEHGARSNQKNMLGLTAAHIAAENGISQAIQILVLNDPSCITTKTEMKETPLYFAVKNDHKECVELLLSCGASTSVMNLRKQRPIDLAKSQDMRFLLNQTSITSKNRSFPVQHKPNAQLHGGQPTSPTWEDLMTSFSEDRATNSNTESPTTTETCKYYGSPSGCARGGKCFYLHDEESPRTKASDGDLSRIDSLARWNHVRRIFVGGLHPSVDSALLQKTCEEKFGPVEDAVIIGARNGDRATHSRGFGFVNFKDKKSVTAALKEHHVTIMGKQAEIKGAVPKYLLLADQFQRHQHLQQRDNQVHAEVEKPEEDSAQNRPTTGNSEGNEDRVLSNAKEENKLELKSWVDIVCHDQPQQEQLRPVIVSDSTSQSQEESMPRWLAVFRKWFPGFLRRVSSSRAEVYALSSLKADFRAEFGLELDHHSLGFSKLSDFVRSIPDLCFPKYLPNANHMILVPARPKPRRPRSPPQPSLPTPTSTSYSNAPVAHNDTHHDGKSSVEDHELEVSSQDNEPTDSHVEASKNVDNVSLQSQGDSTSGLVTPHEFPKPEKAKHVGEHMVLELIAREKNRHHQSTLFLREFDFYEKYKVSVREGQCFRCNLRRTLWANFPCRHLVWCVECKAKVIDAVGSFNHKCVVCDYRVENIDLILDQNQREVHAPYAWRLQK
ncbi:unnamed protein product [Linum trigynum]|uniref:Uncharacterized protein n=1 Tax=Linum trigynum TaxID=586398 RepID=A0AAV2F1Y3_9ROSI